MAVTLRRPLPMGTTTVRDTTTVTMGTTATTGTTAITGITRWVRSEHWPAARHDPVAAKQLRQNLEMSSAPPLLGGAFFSRGSGMAAATNGRRVLPSRSSRLSRTHKPEVEGSPFPRNQLPPFFHQNADKLIRADST